MAEKVEIELNVQDAQAAAAILREINLLVQYQEELRKIEGGSERAGKKGEQAFGGIEKTALQALKAFTGIGSAIGAIVKFSQLVKAEAENARMRQQDIAQAQIDVYGSFRRASAMLVGEKMKPDDLYNSIVKGANGVNPAELFLAFERGMSTAPGMSAEQVRDTVVESAQLAPFYDGSTRGAVVSSALQLQKEFGVGSRQALAGSMQTYKADRSSSPEDAANYLFPGIVQLRQLGSGKDSYEDIAADLIAYGQRTGDPHSRRSVTNRINLQTKIYEETVGAGLVPKGASLKEQLDAVRNSPLLQAKLLGAFAADDLNLTAAQQLQLKRRNSQDAGINQLPGEARTFIASMETVQADQGPGNKLAQERANAAQTIVGLNNQAVAMVEAQDQATRSAKASQTAELNRARMQAESEQKLGQPAEGTKAEVRKSVIEQLRLSGASSFEQLARDAEFAGLQMFGASERTQASVGAGILRSRVQDLEGTTLGTSNVMNALGDMIEKLDRIALGIEQANKTPTKIELPANAQPARPAAANLND